VLKTPGRREDCSRLGIRAGLSASLAPPPCAHFFASKFGSAVLGNLARRPVVRLKSWCLCINLAIGGKVQVQL